MKSTENKNQRFITDNLNKLNDQNKKIIKMNINELIKKSKINQNQYNDSSNHKSHNTINFFSQTYRKFHYNNLYNSKNISI